MFTGIIETTADVVGISHRKNLSELKIKPGKKLSGVKNGDSIAVNGVCLTVTGRKNDVFVFDMMKETLQATTLGGLQAEDTVNVERALKAGDRLDGHFVTGHVDSVGIIKSIIEDENYSEFRIQAQADILKHIVPKGSVCVDGVSLTVGKVSRNIFSVYLIPFTKEVTTFGAKFPGDRVNIETDILAKYVLKGRK